MKLTIAKNFEFSLIFEYKFLLLIEILKFQGSSQKKISCMVEKYTKNCL